MPAVLPASSAPARSAARAAAALPLLLLLLAGAANPAGALAIEILSATQTVDADAFARSGLEFESRARGDGREPGDPADLLLEIETIARTMGTDARGTATVDADLDPRGLVGMGDAASRLIFLPGVPDSEGSASASALLQVLFRVDETFSYALSGSVEALTQAGGDVLALLQLAETDSGLLLFDAQAREMETVPFDTQILLRSGVEYELLVIADSLRDAATPSAVAAFEFALRPVPEPATAAILALGLAGLAAARRRL